MDEAQLLAEQVAYYRERPLEYDEWFLRLGRYDQGSEHRTAWFTEAAMVEAALRETIRTGDVLELACGTGLWTQHLARGDVRVLAIDASAEAIRLNRGRIHSSSVVYLGVDLFSWAPTRTFDAVFLAFWLSHVPPDRFDGFWEMIRTALNPGGTVFFVESLLEDSWAARDPDWLNESGVVRRTMSDGRQLHIVKVFYEPDALERRLVEAGWKGSVRSTGQFFMYGAMTP